MVAGAAEDEVESVEEEMDTQTPEPAAVVSCASHLNILDLEINTDIPAVYPCFQSYGDFRTHTCNPPRNFKRNPDTSIRTAYP